jgi:hypothetical protein
MRPHLFHHPQPRQGKIDESLPRAGRFSASPPATGRRQVQRVAAGDPPAT